MIWVKCTAIYSFNCIYMYNVLQYVCSVLCIVIECKSKAWDQEVVAVAAASQCLDQIMEDLMQHVCLYP